MTDCNDRVMSARVSPPGGAFDAEPDPVLDALADAAASHLTASAAVVSLVLPTIQLFKGRSGLPAELTHLGGIRHTDTLAGTVLRTGAPLEIDDLTRHRPRSPTWSGRYAMRGYLGMPLRLGDRTVGAFEVLDRHPRTWSTSDRVLLQPLVQRAEARLGALEALATAPPTAEAPFADVDALVAALRRARAAARDALVTHGTSSVTVDLERAVRVTGRLLDALDAERGRAGAGSRAGLHAVVETATEMVRLVTDPLGGVRWRLLDAPCALDLPTPVSVAIVSTVLMTLAGSLLARDARSPIESAVDTAGPFARMVFGSPAFEPADGWAVAAALEHLDVDDDRIGFESSARAVCIVLPIDGRGELSSISW